jgi:PadR family transcriptional regulator, regulatory protein AphA
MPVVNKTKYAILGILNLKPGSGYDIKKFIDESIGAFWNENYGHIYPILARLEREGLVIKDTDAEFKGNSKKYCYTITAKGSDEFTEWMKIPVEEATIRDEVLLKLFFGEFVPIEESIYRLELEKSRYVQKLKKYEKIKENIIKTHASKKGYFFWDITINQAICKYKMLIVWCEGSLAELIKMKEREE